MSLKIKEGLQEGRDETVAALNRNIESLKHQLDSLNHLDDCRNHQNPLQKMIDDLLAKNQVLE